MAPDHLRRDCGLVDEDKARRTQLGLLGFQRSAPRGNVRAILLGGVQGLPSLDAHLRETFADPLLPHGSCRREESRILGLAS